MEEARKKLHAYPELSGKEYNTQNLILEFLVLHCDIKAEKIADTGILLQFKGKSSGKTIVIRGDIDALPIREINTFDHQSTVNNVSHKCGHDGHTAILLGLAIQLCEHPIEKGTVYLLFQPSEENGKGAMSVLEDKHFKNLKVDYIFALHNLPGFPMHEVVLKEKEFTANVKSIVVKLKGKTAHAAEPEKGYNPANAIANILTYASERTFNNPSSKNFFLVTPVFVNMGEPAYGISAGYGEVHLTLRSWSTQLMEDECSMLKEFITRQCSLEHLGSELIWLEEFEANVNNGEAVSIIRKAANENKLSITDMEIPFKWGEDFGFFTQRFKGAMFGIGAGEDTPALHNPDYDFPDEIITTGVNLFYKIILKALQY